MEAVITGAVILCLLQFNLFQKQSKALYTHNQSFFRGILSVNNVYMLENLMGLAMNYVNFCMKFFFYLIDRYPTHQVRIILQIYVFFYREVIHFAAPFTDK